MKKALLIGVIVSVLALGGIGAAFATGLNFTNGVGSLSTGVGTVPQVNVTVLNWGPDDLYYNPITEEPTLTRVWITFDQSLNTGTGIIVSVYDGAGTNIGNTVSNLPSPLLAGFVYQSPDFSPLPAISQISAIRVTVAETGYGIP